MALAVTRATPADLRTWDLQVTRMVQSGDLRLRTAETDPLMTDRRHERYDQFYRGLRIVGGDLTRQTAIDGTVSMLGMLHSGLTLGITPAFSVAEATQKIGEAVGGTLVGGIPELVVLPLSDGYHLAYEGEAFDAAELFHVFIDAASGALLQKYSAFQNDVGTGAGAYGDLKKLATTPGGSGFLADDRLRPAEITTYNPAGNFARTVQLLSGATPVTTDIATSSTNTWTDPTVVDAHAYAGWYYDYLFRRFGRHGIDNRDLQMSLITHPVNLADIRTAPASVVGQYYLNAFFCATCGPGRRGAMLFGEGAPASFAGVTVKPFSSSLDVVAHELTHGVTAATAGLNGFPLSEAGALNEGFSDIFGLSTSFFYLPAGNAQMQANYLIGKDLTTPPAAVVPLIGGPLTRSINDPRSTRDPDHYSGRVIGGDPHFNSTILSHAFYLAIEGGTNRTSGRTVQGVGAANRDQIEKAFFRALTTLLPSSSTFALTRVATLQAARDLNGAGSAAERAITQAWDAVGVVERTVPTAAGFAQRAGLSCPAQFPWLFALTVSAGNSGITVNQATFDYYDGNGTFENSDALTAATFSTAFNQCGPGSNRILAQRDACAVLCVNVAPATSGSIQATFQATDDANRSVTFSTSRVVLP